MVYDSPYSTPTGTPLRVEVVEVATPWSEILLEELGTSMRFKAPLRMPRKHKYASNGNARTQLRCLSRVLWLTVLFVVGVWYLLNKSRHAVLYKMEHLHSQPNLDGLQFIDAGHPFIPYVGRWTTSSDGTHKDGPFPGVYFDFVVDGSTTVLLSLHNTDEHCHSSPTLKASPDISFLPPTNTSCVDPISLLARVDDDEYIVLPNSTSIVAIRIGTLDRTSHHKIRIIAPIIGGDDNGIMQVEGLWIDEGGELLADEFRSRKAPGDDSRIQVEANKKGSLVPEESKMLETITDLPGSAVGTYGCKNTGTPRGILGGVMGWEYLLGEMFGTDHVTIGMDGMCLIQDCIGGRGSPTGLSDVFFQSGPVGSAQFAQPWHFQEYIADVMVMNLRNSDWDSFQMHNQEYNRTLWELSVTFEETYVSMIKAIRALAYPKYSSLTIESSRYSNSAQTAGSAIPIFVMRPLRGQLEQATHTVVDRLQKDGDKFVFWLDTSGWLNTEVDFEGRVEDQDFFLDEQSPLKQWRLTERGNQRVAILLHMHLCRYLARESEKCAFLPFEVYQGKALDHEALRFNEFLEGQRERKLKKLFSL